MNAPAPTAALEPATRAARRAEVVAALAPLVPAHAILHQREDTVPYECDGLTAYRQLPLVVVLPESETQVAAVLKACHTLKVPIVARGAGTGLSGGALPHAEGVTLSLAKFNRILAIDRAARTATVQCGVRNLAISEAVAQHGLYYAPDPSSQIACTIGGNVAENSGGVHCLKYGLTLHNVLRVRGFTVEGEAVEFGSEALDAPGLDLLPVIVGSEGMLAVTTEVVVRLTPKPLLARCIMASFDDVRKAGDAVAAIIAEGIIPAGLEMMDKPMTAAVEDFVHAGYDLDAAAILLCESDGTPEEVAEEIERMLAVLAGAGASRMEVSKDEAQRLKFWSGRKNAFPASGRISPDYMCMDSTIPRKRLADILIAIGQMEKKYGLACCNVFHAGDGNLHPLILFDANDPDQLRRAELFGADILETSVEFGSEALDAPGLDLLPIIVGSEGMLAVTTEVVVRLTPKPLLARCIMASFDDVRKAGDAVAAIIAEGIIPAGLEMMDKPMTAAVEDFVHAGYDLDAEAILLCESDGTPEEVAEEIQRMLAVLAGAGASRMEVSKDEAQRLKFWSGRKNAFPASGRISPDYMCMDSTIPRKRLADILIAIGQMEKKYGLACCNVFHAGDGNLHPLILFDANDPDQLRRAELFGADILETSVEFGGTVTGEHGVGVEKLSSMCVQFSPAEREQMLALKRAFDPGSGLNPGKVIPTLARCAEYGKMHVKKGLLPFPGLERF